MVEEVIKGVRGVVLMLCELVTQDSLDSETLT